MNHSHQVSTTGRAAPALLTLALAIALLCARTHRPAITGPDADTTGR